MSAGTELSFQQIFKGAIRGEGSFVYSEKITKNLYRNCKPISKGDFCDKSYRFSNEIENIHLAFVLLAVYELGYATKTMISDWLKWKYKKEPTKEIPLRNCSDPKIREAELGNMLNLLAKNSMLVYSFFKKENSQVNLYSCSYHGAIFFRNILEMHAPFDENSPYRSIGDIYKQADVSYVALALSKSANCSDVSVNGRYGKSNNMPMISSFIYGCIELDRGLPSHQVFILEPMHFRFNTKIMTKEESETKFLERLKLLEKIVDQISKEFDCLTRVIFTFETTGDLRKNLTHLYGDSGLPSIIKDALYTSQNLMRTFDGDLTKSFFRIKSIDNGVLDIAAASNKWAEFYVN